MCSYGNYSVVTSAGRVVAVLFSLVALPLFAYCLDDVTSVMEYYVRHAPG